MWDKAKLATFSRGLATAEKWKPFLAHLAQIAQHMPAFADRVADTQTMNEMNERTAKVALEYNRANSA